MSNQDYNLSLMPPNPFLTSEQRNIFSNIQSQLTTQSFSFYEKPAERFHNKYPMAYPQLIKDQMTYIDLYRTQKEYSKIISEEELSERISFLSSLLNTVDRLPLYPCFYSNWQSDAHPHKLLRIAESLQSQTGLQLYGIVIMLIGVASIATWGRVKIKIYENYYESTVLMLMLISETGTYKSFLCNVAKSLFINWSDEKNITLNSTHQNNSGKMQLAKALSREFGKKNLKSLLKIMETIGSADGMEEIKQKIEAISKTQSQLTSIFENAEPIKIVHDIITFAQLRTIFSRQGECTALLRSGLHKRFRRILEKAILIMDSAELVVNS